MKFINRNMLLIIVCIYILFIYVSSSMLNKRIDSPMHISLDGLDGYVREGFNTSDLLLPDLTDGSWTVLDGASGRDASAFMAQYKKPMFTFRDDKPRNFTYIIKFNVSLQNLTYMRRNADMPALFIAGLSDNWEIYLNGNLLKREVYLDANGYITKHKDKQMFFLPFDGSFLNENENTLIFRIISAPNYQWLGPYRAEGYYIDSYNAILQNANDYQLILLVGIYIFMFFYNFMIFLRSSAERLHFWYSLLCLFLGTYSLSNSALVYFVFDNTFYALILEYASMVFMGMSVILFTNKLIGGTIHKLIKVLMVFSLVLSASMLFGGMQYIDDVLPFAIASCFISVVYGYSRLLIYQIKQIVKRKRAEREPLLMAAYYSLSGTLSGIITLSFTIAIIGTFIAMYRVVFANIDPQSILVLLFAVVIGMAFALNDDVIKTKLMMSSYNASLEEAVEERTHELSKQTQLAVTANESKSKFLATMSHEIRTPMNAIIGIAQMQLQGGELSDRQRDAIDKIYASGHGLLGIINDILDLSKIETGKLELRLASYDVPSFINDTVQLNIVRIGSKPIKFLVDISENVPQRLFGDELRLKQILNNIISNAIKYTEQGAVRLAMSYADGRAEFIVSDTGQGMKPEQVAKLFEEYTRFNAEANRATEGTGLGMSITRQLVSLMEGHIEIESTFGEGSRVKVTVPLEKIGEEIIGQQLSQKLRDFTFIGEGQWADLNIMRTYMPKGRVLIVDDVETNLYVAKGLMSPYGLQIETAVSGFETLEIINNKNTYDIIFLDHMMPEMDGMECCKKLREMGYQGVIIALTANAISGNDKMFTDNGFDGFLSKPVDIRRLDFVLNKYIRKSNVKKEITAYKASAPDSKLFEVFCRDAAKAVIALDETQKSEDLKLFTTTAHAMKSALANVGEDDLSKLAKNLEDAGRNGDREYIAAHTDELINALKAFALPLLQTETSENIEEDTDKLRLQLTKIIAACESYDDDAAYEAIEEAKASPLKASTIKELEKIHETLFFESDFENAVKLARTIQPGN